MTSRHRQTLGERATKEFGHSGGTIGRSLESDWVLPDSQRYISSRHASIDYRSGSYYIVDTSTNGVYVNASDTPVGRGNPQRLFNADRIRLGEYEMVVEIDGEASTMETLLDGDHVDPVWRRQRVDPPDPTSADLVQPHEITAVGIEILISEEAEAGAIRHAAKLAAAGLRLEDDPPAKPTQQTQALHEPTPAAPARPQTAAAPTAAPAPAPPARPQKPPPKPIAASSIAGGSLLASTGSNPRLAPRSPQVPDAAATAGQSPAVAPRIPPAPARAPATVSAPSTAAATTAATRRTSGATTELDAFFRGAGLEPQRLDERQADVTLHLLGQLMREMIVGLTENLHVRAEHKTAIRVANTTIQPQANNALKFAAGVDEALKNLLFREPSSEYLTPVDAVREAFLDIKVHQQSLLNGLRTALADYVARLDPDELESKFTNGRRGGIMNAANKLKYWDLYKDLYQVVTQPASGQLPQLFIEDLGRAYEQEAARTGGSPHKPHAKAAS
jgi:type VI secretion system protein